MIKIYGMPTCPYCAYVDEQVKGDNRFAVIDIGANVRNMSAFMHLRDSNPVFDHSKAIGDIGIPAFVKEDGTVTLKPEEVGLKEFNPDEAASCSLDGKGC
ncbi:MAG: glutaredoxin-related protein [Prevotella sp.]|jgi:glutaredoxin-related protein|nr:glutaredoxin-related protein [Prevotella sp.]